EGDDRTPLVRIVQVAEVDRHQQLVVGRPSQPCPGRDVQTRVNDATGRALDHLKVLVAAFGDDHSEVGAVLCGGQREQSRGERAIRPLECVLQSERRDVVDLYEDRVRTTGGSD